MKNYILLPLFFLIMFSCTEVVKTVYGVKDPNLPVTDSAVMKFVRENNLTIENNYRPVSEPDYEKVMNVFSKRISDAILFDKTGKQINFKLNAKSCSEEIENLNQLNQATTFPYIPNSINQEEFSQLLDKISNEEITKDADYTLYISWASFMGKRFNKENTYLWEQIARNNKKAKIRVCKINMDLKNDWLSKTGID